MPSEWIDKYRGKFAQGWDVVREQTLARQKRLGVVPLDTELPPRPDWIPAWDHLSPDEQRLYARMMEVFAGCLSYADHQIGRLTDTLVKTGDIANTLFFVVSDNGASAEGGLAGSFDQGRWFNGSPEGLEENLSRLDQLGGPGSYNHYPAGWAMAGNTPLRGFKGDVLEGGTKVPLIVCWQRGIRSRGEVRRQYVHAIDLVPTVLTALGAAAPEVINGVRQSPLEGVSFAYSFAAPEEPTRREAQYFELLGRRAIWHKDWKAVADHRPDSGQDFIHDRWELYHLAGDASECRDLAASYPDELRELIERWWVEASKYNVLPLDDRLIGRLEERRPKPGRPRTSFTYYPDTSEVHASAAALTLGGSLTITAELEIPVGGAEGVLFAQGSRRGGHCLFVKDQRPVYVHSYIDGEEYTVTADRHLPLPSGRVVVRLRLARTGRGEGLGVLYVNGVTVGEGMIEHITPVTFSATRSGIRIGRDSAPGVSCRYDPPFAFTGSVEKVVVEVRGEQAWDSEAEARTILARG